MPIWFEEYMRYLVKHPWIYVLNWVILSIGFLIIREIILSLIRSNYRILPGTTKKGLCEAGIRWCEQTLGKAKFKPKVVMSYTRRPLRRLGSYRGTGEIVIHVNHSGHSNLQDLANTIIHEYTHALQFTSQKEHMRYQQETERVGYYNNPFEKEARKVASEHEDALLAFWKKTGMIG